MTFAPFRFKSAVTLFAALTLAPLAASAQDKAGWPQRMTFASGPTGSFGHTTGSPWATTVGADIGVPISPETTRGVGISAMMVDEKKADVAFGFSDIAWQGWQGAEFSKGKPVRNIRTLMVLDATVWQLYALKKSNFKSVSDLNGKSVNPSGRNSGTDILLRDMVSLLGLKPARIQNVNPPDANSQLGDGRLDFAAVTGGTPHPAISEIEVNNEIVLIPLTVEEQKKLIAKFPALSAHEIPAGAYKSVTQPVRTVAAAIVYLVNKDMPDSLAYALTKATFAKKDALAAAHRSFANIDPKNSVRASIPIHSGAIKYYEEQGVKIPASLR